jgi:hypothetical protein
MGVTTTAFTTTTTTTTTPTTAPAGAFHIVVLNAASFGPPTSFNVQINDTIRFVLVAGTHIIVSGKACPAKDNLFADSPLLSTVGQTFDVPISSATYTVGNTYGAFCSIHGCVMSLNFTIV